MVVYKKPKVPTPPIPTGDWVSVDPGDVHVGVCYWNGREPQWAKEFRPDEFVDWLILKMSNKELELVVYEIFLLYNHKAVQQTGSTFGTAELIGVMRHLCRRAEVPFHGYQASVHKTLYKNLDYRPPRKPLRAWVSYGEGPHTKDAECVGLWFLRCHELMAKGFM